MLIDNSRPQSLLNTEKGKLLQRYRLTSFPKLHLSPPNVRKNGAQETLNKLQKINGTFAN